MSSFKEQEKLRREEAILTAAKALFAENGYDRVALEEVAEKVGVAKGTIYLHFSSKEDLLLAILARKQAQLLTMLDQVVGDDPAETFSRCLDIIFRLWADDLDFMIILEKELFAKGNKPKSNPLFDRMLEIVQSAQAAGVIAKTLEPTLVTYSILKPIPFRIAGHLLKNHGLTKDTLSANLRQIILHGIYDKT